MCHLPVQHTVDWSTESEDKAIGRHCLHSAQLAFVDSAFQESEWLSPQPTRLGYPYGRGDRRAGQGDPSTFNIDPSYRLHAFTSQTDTPGSSIGVVRKPWVRRQWLSYAVVQHGS
jgi:hypothetical protein